HQSMRSEDATGESNARDTDLDEVIQAHAAMAAVRVRVEGGSAFTAPTKHERIGGSNRRAIWITERPITTLLQTLRTSEYWSARVRTEQLDDGGHCWHVVGKEGARDDWIALPEPNIAFITNDKMDLESMIDAWR